MSEAISRTLYLFAPRRMAPVQLVENSLVPIEMTLVDYTIPTGATVKAYARGESSGTTYVATCTVTGNVVRLVPPAMFFAPGNNYLQIEINETMIPLALLVQCQEQLSNQQNDTSTPETVKPLVVQAQEILAECKQVSVKTPYVGENENWYVWDTATNAFKDSGVSSRGVKGDKGDKGDPGADGKDAPQINDTAISAANPWSSKHIVDMLCPPLEESGNPVVCYPVAGYPLGVTVNWEPTQEGNGDPSPDNIRPIKGRESVTITRQEDNQVITLTLPGTVYGGEVDAVSSEVAETWGVVTLDGEEGWMVSGKFLADKSDWYYVSPKIPGAVNESPQKGNNICSHYPYADVANRNTVNGCAIVWSAIRVRWGDTIPDNADSWKAYLAAQYAAGTPVQVAYRLATPVPFSATGAQPINALSGVNTILTDADTVTVTGRADPIKRITDLEDALASVTTND